MVALGTILCRSRSTSLPLRDTRQLVAALRKALELDLLGYALREYRDLRRYCVDCAENSAEVRRCTIIDCPWPYRMGGNPYNPKRGTNPFSPTPKAEAACH